MLTKNFILSPMQNRNHEIRKAGKVVCQWSLNEMDYSLWETPRHLVEGVADSTENPHVLVIDCDHGLLHTEVLLDSAYGRTPEPMALQLANGAKAAADLSRQVLGSAIISRYVNALALDNTPEAYLGDLEKAKKLALMEIRAEGPVTNLTINGWLSEQGGETVASLTAEAIQDLLDEKLIEVYDPEDEAPSYGYCGPTNR